MATKRMTANPVKPARYRPGKPLAEEDSDEDYGSEEEHAQQPQNVPAPPPKASSFPSDATKITRNLKDVDLSERKRQAAAKEAARVKTEEVEPVGEEEGFMTEESDDESSEEEQDSEGTSEAEESSSEDEVPRPLLRPTFIKKDKRNEASQLQNKADDQIRAEQAAMKRERTDAMIQEQLEKDAAARALGMKDWDNNENQDVEQVDDTDGLDPEMERAAWKLRELKRVKRDREAVEAAEKEREEIERRRNLSKEAREAEDAEFLEEQKAQRDGKGKMGYMQKYYHKGVFFQDDAKAESLEQRDIMGSRYQDDALNRELLPQYMQIRDMTKLGRKGRTKYKDLKTEDTGQWGQYQDKHHRKDGITDERFQPDKDQGRKGPSGANTTTIGQRKAPGGAPLRLGGGNSPDRGHRFSEGAHSFTRRERDRDFDDHNKRNRSPPHEYRRRRSSYSHSRSPPPRRNYSDRSRRSFSRSKSPSSDQARSRDDRRKRSPPYHDHYASDKRRRVDAL
ncbi:MAG: hypothetical protein Q9167_005564 [Letrouitia subvulpina]